MRPDELTGQRQSGKRSGCRAASGFLDLVTSVIGSAVLPSFKNCMAKLGYEQLRDSKLHASIKRTRTLQIGFAGTEALPNLHTRR